MEAISRLRRDILLERERKGVQGTSKVAFKDGSLLAFLYGAGLVIINMVLVLWVHSASSSYDGWGRRDGIMRSIGALSITVCAVFGTRVLLRMLSPTILARNSRICLLTVLSLLSVGITACLRYTAEVYLGEHFKAAVSFLYPYALTPALATLLLRRRRAGVAVGIGTSMLMGMYETSRDNSPLIVFFLGILTAMALPYLLTHVRRRLQLFRVMMFSSLLLMVGIYIFMAINPDRVNLDEFFTGHLSLSIVGLQLGACIAGGVMYTVLILVMLPLLERIFGVCSDISLNGFADLGSPLLERLATEAPGTYAHSLATATIATAAAERVDASALLVRVGCFYHDIGKLGAPPLFIENTTPERNPHNTLSPSTSATWVRSHIKDGVVFARKAGLPPAILDILREHHGTTLMVPFLHKAREIAKADEAKQPQRAQRVIIDESQFRYEGPCPSTKEAAIVMLADSVEAASRSLSNVTSGTLEHLVQNIIETKLKDGQLDDAPLSMMELTEIKKSFVSSLGTILHARMRYPKEEQKE